MAYENLVRAVLTDPATWTFNKAAAPFRPPIGPGVVLLIDSEHRIGQAEYIGYASVTETATSFVLEGVTRAQEGSAQQTWSAGAILLQPSLASLMNKLELIETEATKNATDAQLRDRATHTGEQPISTVTGLQAQLDAIGTLLSSNDTTLDQLQEIVDFIKINRADLDALSIAGVAGLQSALNQKVDKVAGKQLSTEDYSSAEKTKLAGIATGATKNATDAQLRNRATHTGEQAISTVTGLQDALDGKATAVQGAKADTALQPGASPMILSVDPLRKAVESESGGRQTVIYTTKGEPCIMYVLPRFNMGDIPGWTAGTGTHPAFLFNGVAATEIFIGVHEAAEFNGEAVSQAGRAPWVSINYDNARSACQANGAGWDLMSIWDWAAIALWCKANGFEPRGNTNHGRHHDAKWETGVRQDGATYAPGDSSGVGNILTGSGPNTWRHDNSPAGISDLVGNVWEWLYGMKIIDGVVQLAPDNGDYLESEYTNTAFTLPSNRIWSTIDATGAPDSLKQALIVPNGVADPLGYHYITLTGERLPIRGGNRSTAGNAGLAAVGLSATRGGADSGIGFRPRFRNP